jgi:membrane protein YqaA with SNARE-associated domain
MGVLVIAALWGVAEATLFFVVPDVLLSAIAIRNPRAALVASLLAVLGAMVGGSLMYFWGAKNPDAAVRIVAAVPAVGPEMMTRVRAELRERGSIAVVLGPLSATPYKTYAVQAAAAGIPYWLFLLITPLARLPRFLVVSLLAGSVARALKPRVSIRALYALWLVVWLAVYATLWRSIL